MEIENSSPLELAKFLLLEMDHINTQLLITTVTLALELASLEPDGDDPTWFGTSDIPKSKTRLRNQYVATKPCCAILLYISQCRCGLRELI